MGRARIYRSRKRPNLYHYRDDYYDHEAGHYTVIDDDTIRAELYVASWTRAARKSCNNGRRR